MGEGVTLTKKVCPDCNGEGYSFFINQGEPDLDSKCGTCKGTGKVPDVPQPPAPPSPRLIKEGGETIWKSISNWLKKDKNICSCEEEYEVELLTLEPPTAKCTHCGKMISDKTKKKLNEDYHQFDKMFEGLEEKTE